MKNTAKLIVISVFALGALFIFLSCNNLSGISAAVFSDAAAQPTPPKGKKTPAAVNATNTAPSAANTSPSSLANTTVNKATPATTVTPATPSPVATSTPTTSVPPGIPTGGKPLPTSFTLGKDSMDGTWGEVAFNHDNHAFMNYSADGRSPVTCVECHHTDQPKPSPPDVTSERKETLTYDVFNKSPQKVNDCRVCHFQPGSETEGKSIPTVTYDWDNNGKSTKKTLDNKIAYHINCNVCHDKAAALRPDLKKKRDFATTNDCGKCHKPIS